MMKVSQEYFNKVWNPVKETGNQFQKKFNEPKEKKENPTLHKVKELAGTSGEYLGKAMRGTA